MRSRTLYLAIYELRLLRIMSPVLQTLVGVAASVLFGLLLLGEVPLVVCCHLSHMGDIILVILGRVLFGILLEDLNNLTTTGNVSKSPRLGRLVSPFVAYALSGAGIMAPTGLFGRVALQPFLQILGCHIDCVIEIPIWSVEGLMGGDGDLLDDIFLAFDHSGGVEGEAVY